MQFSKQMLLALVAAGVVAASALPASAACTRLAFSVNDYGKDGPTRDAKELLDKYIAKTMAAKGVSKYTTGKKDVTCELFLNFIVFDEHTCKAEATVCWDGSALPKSEQVSAEGNDAAKQATGSIEKSAEKPAKKKAASGEAVSAKGNSAKVKETGSVEHAAVKESPAPAEKAPAKPAEPTLEAPAVVPPAPAAAQ